MNQFSLQPEKNTEIVCSGLDDYSLVASLTACARRKDLHGGSKLHAVLLQKGLLRKNVFVGNALINMYAKCGILTQAEEVFDQLIIRDVVSWNALVAGYAQHGHCEKAMDSFHQMQQEGFSPDEVTFSCILKACASLRKVQRGKELHAKIVGTVSMVNNTVLGNALLDMYAKCGSLQKAQQMKGEGFFPDVMTLGCLLKVCGSLGAKEKGKQIHAEICINGFLMKGYCLHGHPKEALTCFEHMKKEGLSPDKVTFGLVLKACGSIGSSDHGIIVHAEIARRQLLKMGIIHGNALVDMYAKCDELAKAQEVFDGLPFRDAISWTALIDGYSQHGQGEQALKCFEHMKSEGLSPDRVTFSCALKACGSIGAVDKGKDLHSEIARKGLLGKDTMLGGALVDMYCSCGALEMAREVFEELPFCNVITYSALIAGFCEHGYGEEALDYFEEMVGKDLIPDVVTFGCVLKACGSIGDVEKGQKHFDAMTTKYGINPSPEHYTCMVDIFGRAGDLEKAMATIRKMPSSDHLPAWFALMGACKKWGDVKLGKEAFENVVQIDEKATAAYLFMRDIYAAAGMQEDARMIESLGLAKGKQNFASFEEDYELII